MAEENKNENKASRRRAQRPLAERTVYPEKEDLDPNAPNELKMRHPLEVEGPTTDASQWGTGYDTTDVDDARVIKEGDPIEVKTDDNGYATETVLREVSLMNTDRKTYVLIATEGARYNS